MAVEMSDTLAEGLAHHRAGRLDAARAAYAAVLAADPANADALHLLGVTGLMQGRSAEGVALLRQALAARPDFAEAWGNLALALTALRDDPGALAAWRHAVALAPQRAEWQLNLGIALRAAGARTEAIATLRACLALRPDWVPALVTLGVTLGEDGQTEASRACFEHALRIDPSHAEAGLNLATALAAEYRLDEAIAHLRALIAHHPGRADAHLKLGILLAERGQDEAALAAYDAALALRPDDAETHMNRGVSLLAVLRAPEAVANQRRALELRPNHPQAWLNLGHALRESQDFPGAEAAYRTALTHNPALAAALDGLGMTLRLSGRTQDAVATLRDAVAAAPTSDFAHTNLAEALLDLGETDAAEASYRAALACPHRTIQQRWNAGLTHLLLGDYAKGWPGYELRTQLPEAAARPHFPGRPEWDGTTSLAGRTILLTAEQGFGDTLQFIRFAKLLAARGAAAGGARVLVAPQPALSRLLAQIPGLTICDPTALPDFDVHLPLPSLPHRLAITRDTIPGTPYLTAPTPRALEPGPRHIGLVVSGSAKGISRGRHIPLALLRPLLRHPDCRFHLLQPDLLPADTTALTGIADHRSELHDFADTANLAAAMDLILTVDTAAAHLAGALGRPTAVMLQATPEWRWSLHGHTTPWYPSTHLFRQPTGGDWTSVVHEISKMLF